jgi:hypothetical protein
MELLDLMLMAMAIGTVVLLAAWGMVALGANEMSEEEFRRSWPRCSTTSRSHELAQHLGWDEDGVRGLGL